MKADQGSQKPAEKEKKKTFMGWFVAREEPDEDYLPDLKSQWAKMERAERIKFIFGGIFGVVVFIAALVLVYFLLAAIVGWLGFG